jgi:hypothetical protein
MENDVLRQLTISGRSKGRGNNPGPATGFQDMGGRIARYPLRVGKGARALAIRSWDSAGWTR